MKKLAAVYVSAYICTTVIQNERRDSRLNNLLLMPDIHKKIISVRKKRNLSQLQASELVNIPIRTYQRIESGETTVNLDYLNRLAEGFQCSADDILHYDLETNEFPTENTAMLTQKNQMLEEENGRLKQFVKLLTEQFRGGG